MVEEMGGPVLPVAFVAFRNLTRIHLKQILKLDRLTTKLPMHAVALLVMVAYEALGKFTDPPPGTERTTAWLFAKRHYDRYRIDVRIGELIFNAIRHGLAHRYGHYPVPVDELGEIRLVLTWKGGPHFQGVSTTIVDGHQWLSPFPKGSKELPRALCIDAGSLWADLDGLFTEVGTELAEDPVAAARYEELVAENARWQAERLTGGDPAAWRSLLASRRLEATE